MDLSPPRPSHTSAGTRPTTDFRQLTAATQDLEPPYAVIDLAALRYNVADLVRRANGTPIRPASKSVRSRAVIRDVLAVPGFAGVLAYTLPEALWLADDIDDVVVGYPSVDRTALRALAGDDRLRSRVTVMIDSEDHLDLTAAALRGVAGSGSIRVSLDVDASLRLAGGRVHLGARRSPLHSVQDVTRLARAVVRRPGFELVGLMAYEAQIAGVGDDPPSRLRGLGVRRMQRTSAAELRERRAAVVDAVRELAAIEFVNGGGTGSAELTASEPAVTEVAAGSGLYAPTLFDHYTRFTPAPAAYFALPVVRRPSPRHATVLGGGWIASGQAGSDRLPTPVWPPGLKLVPAEGAGEVQTPLTGEGVDTLAVGDRVWFRHTKAGELCEHVDDLHVVEGDSVVESATTYRGEGKVFL
jgi:D-serine deaminase-like pyridoxal phosphate-dependent protein